LEEASITYLTKPDIFFNYQSIAQDTDAQSGSQNSLGRAMKSLE